MRSMFSRRGIGESAGILNPQRMFLSKVTYLLVFDRLPDLTLDIRCGELVSWQVPGGDGPGHQDA